MGKNQENMKGNIQENISEIIQKVGMLYFEYDPIHHTAVRRECILGEDGLPDKVDDYPECFIEKTVHNAEQAEIFRQAFQRIDAGSTHENFEVELDFAGQGSMRRFLFHLIAINPAKVVCVASDVTEQYVDRSMEKILLRKQFDGVSIIAADGSKYRLRFFKSDPAVKNVLLDDYAAGSIEAAKQYVLQEDQELFLERTSLSTIKTQLDQNECYSFTMNGID